MTGRYVHERPGAVSITALHGNSSIRMLRTEQTRNCQVRNDPIVELRAFLALKKMVWLLSKPGFCLASGGKKGRNLNVKEKLRR